MPEPVHIDFETYYDTQCSVKTLGPWAYTRHPKFDVYYSSIYDGQEFYGGHPLEFGWSSLDDRHCVSHNAAFDRAVFSSLGEKFFPASWNCSANLAAYMKSDRNLKAAAKNFLGVEISKDVRTAMRGKTWEVARQLGAIDSTKHSTLGEQLEEYAEMDAKVGYALWKKLSPEWPDFEKQLSLHTLDMCEHGLLIDSEYVTKCVSALQEEVFHAAKRLPWREDSESPALSKIKFDLQCRKEGIAPPKSLAEDNADFLLWEAKYGNQFEWAKDMRIVRKSNILLKRFLRLSNSLNDRGRFQFGLKYFGAHPGRWSGDSGFNVHNFPRDPYTTETGLLCDLRRAIVAPSGKKFLIIDFAQIEARILAHVANQQSILALVRSGQSIYEAHARLTMGWTGGVLKTEDYQKYLLAKTRVLGLGYGCGPMKFADIALLMSGIKLTEQESKQIVFQYRRSNPGIYSLWKRLDACLLNSSGGDCEIELPIGRCLKYFNVQVGANGREITAQTTINGARKKVWGALLCENLIQGIARDVLAENILRLERAGFRVLFHVHDEVILEVDKDAELRDAMNIMEVEPEWLEGCPIGVEGVESTFYKK